MEQLMCAQIIRYLRENAEFTQQEVAERLGVSRACYSMYEIGKRTPPLPFLIRLASFYEVSLDYLICGHVSPRTGKVITEREQQLLNDFAALSAEAQREVRIYMQYRKHFQL